MVGDSDKAPTVSRKSEPDKSSKVGQHPRTLSISGFAYANVTLTRARQPPGLLHRWRDGDDGSRGRAVRRRRLGEWARRRSMMTSRSSWNCEFGRGRAESSCYPISSRSLRPMASGSSGRRQAGLKPMMPLAACEGSTWIDGAPFCSAMQTSMPVILKPRSSVRMNLGVAPPVRTSVRALRRASPARASGHGGFAHSLPTLHYRPIPCGESGQPVFIDQTRGWRPLLRRHGCTFRQTGNSFNDSAWPLAATIAIHARSFPFHPSL